MEQIVEKKLIEAAQIVEEQVDAELNKLENLDDDELEKLRRQKLESMKKMAAQKQQWLMQGHGEYSELSSEKEFFDVCKKSDRVVCHFFKDDTFRCKIVDKHVEMLCKKHLETKFVKINVERAPFLCKRLKIRILPTISLVRNAKTTDYVVGFDDLGGIDEFSTEMLEWRLAKSDLLFYSGDLMTPPDCAFEGKQKKMFYRQQKSIRARNDDESDDDDDY